MSFSFMISVKKCIREVGGTVHFQKIAQTGPPLCIVPIPAIVNVWTKHENFKADAADLDIDRFW